MAIIDLEYPFETFIGGYNIPNNLCDGLLEYYEINKERARSGLVYDVDDNTPIVNEETKQSLDLAISTQDLHKPIHEYRVALLECMKAYLVKYTYADQMCKMQIRQNINIQYYDKGWGFKEWHFERVSLESSHRAFAFITYLNDVNDGGTEFFYQNFKTDAKKGNTVIFPADWTHTHRGVISQEQEKYIITGWYSYLQ